MKKSASRNQLPTKEPSRGKKPPKDYEEIKDLLQKNKDLYKLVIENIHDILCTLDMDGRFTFVNDTLLAKTGRPRESFLGRSYLEMIQLKDRGAVHEVLNAVLRGETVPAFELAYDTPSGAIWLEIKATPLVDDGQFIGILIISCDISGRKKIEEELELYRNTLEELVKNRTEELSAANKRLQ
ncbi:MAG: multi-sensor hybrid histidine kinase, partial [Nitrospirae bacterium]|nr:multi-sensor hybrid histidine kinase [Nitrospirota bacterium]